jgi:hypothetical protein
MMRINSIERIKQKTGYSGVELLLLSGVIIFSLLYIITIFTRFPNGDEGLQAEHVYFLDKLGFVKSDIWAGYGYGWEVKQFHYHKGLILLGVLFNNLFGFSLPSLRLIAVVFYLLFVYFLFLFFRDLKHKNSNLFFLITLFLLLLSNVFAEFVFIYRPEVVMMSLGMGAIYFLQKGLAKEKVRFIIYAGLLTGLAAFTHLIGIVLVIAGGITLLWFRQFKYAMVFGLFATLALCLYFYDLLSAESFRGFLFQFTNEASIADKQANPLGHIFSEHMRFFSSEVEAMFSILFFMSLAANYRYLRQNHGIFLVFGIASMLTMMFVSHTATPKYALLYFPFMAFVIALSIIRYSGYRKYYRIIFTVFLSMFLGYHTYRDLKLITPRVDIAERNNEIASHLPGKYSNVTSFSTFVFNEIEYFTIHGFLAIYRYYTKNRPGYDRTTQDMFEFCDNMNDRYIIIDRLVLTDKFFRFIEKEKIKKGDIRGMYRVIQARNNYYIFENMRLAKEVR